MQNETPWTLVRWLHEGVNILRYMTSSQRRKAVRFSVSAINEANSKILDTVVEMLMVAGMSEQDARALAMSRAKDIRIQVGNVAISHMNHEDEE